MGLHIDGKPTKKDLIKIKKFKDLIEKESKKNKMDLKNEKEELWDWICSRVGFDEKGKDIQGAIRRFVKLKERELVESCPIFKNPQMDIYTDGKSGLVKTEDIKRELIDPAKDWKQTQLKRLEDN